MAAMKICTVIATVSFGPGVRLGLSEAQAGARRLLLRPVGDNRYEAVAPVQFKAGEIIGIEGDVPKNLQPLLAEQPDVAKAASTSPKSGKPTRETAR